MEVDCYTDLQQIFLVVKMTNLSGVLYMLNDVKGINCIKNNKKEVIEQNLLYRKFIYSFLKCMVDERKKIFF